ncbi:MAG: hypothetical protein Alpg2KO_07910 [Alphaproteobacteria bacterium]
MTRSAAFANAPMSYSDRMATRINALAKAAETQSLFSAQAKAVTDRLKAGGYKDHDALGQDLLDLQRLGLIHAAGLQNNKAFADRLAKSMPVKFAEFQDFPGESYLKDRFGYHMADAFQKHDKPPLLIEAGGMARDMLGRVIDHAVAKGKPVDVRFTDYGFEYAVLSEATARGARGASRWLHGIYSGIGRAAKLLDTGATRLNTPIMQLAPDANKRISTYMAGMAGPMKKSSQLKPLFTYTCLPTAADAKLENMDYADYSRLFLEMADQPWDQIHEAQAHLLKELNAAKKIRFTNADGTDLSMSIDGFSFVNTHIDANVPGSEVFSAPKKDSVEGVVVAKGSYLPPGSREKVQDIRLRFSKGKVVEHYARRGGKVLERVLNMDKGAKFVGEIAIGTNPALTRQVHNILMVEKISGSFHFALGNSYSFKEFRGEPAKLDNGNRSRLHWDLTTMLAGKQGTIELDGRKIMEDGRFIDAKYDVLNRGWKAVPKAKRPDYWKAKLAAAGKPATPPKP